MLVYVLDQEGNPLMPTQKLGFVRHVLKEKRAKIVDHNPFTIQLQYETEMHNTQPIYVGIDPGRTNIGISAVQSDGTVLYKAECVTRNKEIKDLMLERKQHRQASRRGERLARKRLAKKLHTTTKHLEGRILPGCKKPLMYKDIINTEARFNNRLRKPGWLTPTATQLLRTHINLLNKVRKILPVTAVVLEVNKFAFMQLDNPDLAKYQIQFQKGPLYYTNGLHDAVSIQQDHHCLLCENPIGTIII